MPAVSLWYLLVHPHGVALESNLAFDLTVVSLSPVLPDIK